MVIVEMVLYRLQKDPYCDQDMSRGQGELVSLMGMVSNLLGKYVLFSKLNFLFFKTGWKRLLTCVPKF